MSTGAHLAAIDIASAILEITGTALMNGDFDAFAAVFHTPQMMATMTGPVHMETVEDMRRAFDEMHRHFKETGVTDMIREVVAADYTSDTRIESTHVSEVLRNGKRQAQPYPVFSVIEKIDGTWKVTASEYALEDSNGQARAIQQADKKYRQGAVG